MKRWVLKHDNLVQRLLEITPGFVSWNLILFPYWGIFVIPNVVAYFVLMFDVYWFYQSFQTAIMAIVSHLKIQASKNHNWLEEIKYFPDNKRVRHVVIIPTYKEPLHTLERTIKSLVKQDMPTKQIIVTLAMEEREIKQERDEKFKYLKKKYAKFFDRFLMTVHKLVPGEVAGKASNERFAAIYIKENIVRKRKYGIEYMTVTSCDADHKFHPKHFSYLTYKFLDEPKRYKMFWQPAVMFYNNIWEIPAITRAPNTLMSIWNLSQLPRKDRLINAQNYSLSFKLLDKVDYWDADKIPEDWGIFFKAFYKMRGGIEVKPIYLPIFADAPQSTSFFKTLKNQYRQIQRWAWGVSDDPWIIKNYFLTPGVPFWDKTTRLFYVIWAHFLWPVNWFIVTIGLTLPTLLNPAFGRTALGYTVPKLSQLVLTLAASFILIIIILERFYKPQRPKKIPRWREFISPLEFILMPIAGFFFSALPGIDAHTRLMLGKYIQYRVTEKV